MNLHHFRHRSDSDAAGAARMLDKVPAERLTKDPLARVLFSKPRVVAELLRTRRDLTREFLDRAAQDSCEPALDRMGGRATEVLRLLAERNHLPDETVRRLQGEISALSVAPPSSLHTTMSRASIAFEVLLLQLGGLDGLDLAELLPRIPIDPTDLGRALMHPAMTPLAWVEIELHLADLAADGLVPGMPPEDALPPQVAAMSDARIATLIRDVAPHRPRATLRMYRRARPRLFASSDPEVVATLLRVPVQSVRVDVIACINETSHRPPRTNESRQA